MSRNWFRSQFGSSWPSDSLKTSKWAVMDILVCLMEQVYVPLSSWLTFNSSMVPLVSRETRRSDRRGKEPSPTSLEKHTHTHIRVYQLLYMVCAKKKRSPLAFPPCNMRSWRSKGFTVHLYVFAFCNFVDDCVRGQDLRRKLWRWTGDSGPQWD